MSKTLAIQVQNISKLYRLGQIGTGTLSHDLKRWWYNVQGKEDPFSKIGSTNDRTKKADSAYSWALRDISFDVQQGEVLGIIGANGAGKSTLLKILSRVTSPTEGSIKIKGRVASLLEVGTGFHPEMTGKENIYMNGAILGMTKNEIKRKFDDIVEFAGVARYVDTPVKRYSSGMYVRLAFAVAAHLESEILIVDEVLAVGDFDFQRKCLSKMDSIAKGEGRTVLFVSHNLPAVQTLCTKGISLQFGQVRMVGEVSSVIADYLKKGDVNTSIGWTLAPEKIPSKKNAYISKMEFLSEFEGFIRMGDDIIISFVISLKETVPPLQLRLRIYNSDEALVTSLYNTDYSQHLEYKPGDNKVTVRIKQPNLLPGDYYLSAALIYRSIGEYYDNVDFGIKFGVAVHDVTGAGVSFLSDRGEVWFNADFKVD